ncbi:MAG TPA: SusC/RagA family TonB-linked outer membrane protein [Bacteroidales bacterium]|nr:SusC/RagA family TonB-linked outer membrane protein [Bacteroidales bacterium]
MKMAPEIKSLEEVVVVGYGVQKKSNVTGAISQVKGEDIENRTITRAEEALQGKSAGVQIVNTSGAPGSSPTVRIRGVASNSSSDPLYVVDGLRVSNIGSIDPNNIESMEVLKDAASAAIYGAEAGNGVILITTKKGKNGTSKLSYDFQYSIQDINNIPDMMNASEYITYMTEANRITDFSVWEKDGKPDTKWADVAFESSIMEKHNLSLQGGNDKGSYFVSLAYLKNDGIVKGDRDVYKRLTATINGEYKIKPWIKVGTTNTIEKWERSSVSENNEYGSLVTSVLQLDPLTPDVYDPDKLPLHMQQAKQAAEDKGTVLMTNDKGQYYGLSAYYIAEQVHPMIMRDRTFSKGQNFNIVGTIYGDFTPFKNFVLTSRLGYMLSAAGSNSFSPDFYANGTVSSLNISANADLANTIYYQWENFANYNLAVNKNTFNLMAGTSFSENNYLNLSGSVNKITKDDPLFWYIAGQTGDAVKTVSGGRPVTSAKLSYYGRFNYNYANKYFFEALFRADAADLSILSKTQRWGYFPAFSAGWTLSEENFMKNLNTPISYLKVRGSWGQNGSIAGLQDYSWRSSISNTGSYPFILDGETVEYISGSAPSGLGNSELKWETHQQFDIGVDIRAFGDRLSFAVDYFKKKTKDLILTGITPSLSTGSTYPVNAGNIENSGIEIELGWKQNLNDFHYGVSANLATLHNEVTYIHPSISRINGASFHTYTGLSVFEKGYPAWYMRGYKFTGIDDATGEPQFADISGDGEIGDADKTKIGSAIPDYTYGLTLSAGYKGFDFVVFGTGSQGNDIFQALVRNDRPTANRLKYYYDNRWTPQNKTASAPKAGFSAQDNYFTSSAVVFDGSYFKVKQIQLGYTIPKSISKKWFVENARVYTSLDDWFVFTEYKGFDPEASTNGGSARGFDKGSYPNSRKVVFGINVTF